MKIEARHIAGILRAENVDIRQIGYTRVAESLADSLNRDHDTRRKVDELQAAIDDVQDEYDYARKALDQEFDVDMNRLDAEMAVLVKECPHTVFQIVPTNGMDIPVCDICNGVVEEEVVG